MKKISTLLILTFFLRSLIAQIPNGYYDGTDGLSGEALKTTLYNIIKGHTEFQYTSSSTDTWDILKLSDQDTTIVNSPNIIMIYSGLIIDAAQEWNSGNGWSREHVWSKSHGFPPADGEDPAPGAGTDCHHLRPEKPAVNSAKGNKDFDMGGTPVESAPGCYSTSDTWEPRDDVKGDVARMIFYMATRYRGENGEPNLEIVDYTPSITAPTYQQPLYGKLSTLLLWNLQDPPNNFEKHRNDVVYAFQGNRNPYIDHPEWVNCIWSDCNQVAFTSLPDTTDNVNLLYNYDITFIGLSGSTLEISTENLPEWLVLIQTSNTTANLSGTPDETYIGENSVSLFLTDGTSTVLQEFKIHVTEPGTGIVIVNQDFTSCPPENWSTYNVTGTKNWTCTGGYEEINAWVYSGGTACDDWLISPQMDLSSFSSVTLSFKTWTRYIDTNYPRLTLNYSSDYVIGQNPENYTWTEVQCTLSADDSQIWTESGVIDLSDKTDASAYIAFNYTSSGSTTGAASWWKVDDIIISGNQSTVTTYNISATSNPSEGGLITGSGNYASNSTATLTAIENEGYEFVNWTENDNNVSTNSTYTFTVTNNRSLVANFTPVIVEIPQNIAEKIDIQIFPNPAENFVSLSILLSKKTEIDIDIFNISGQKIKTVAEELRNSGNNFFRIDISDLQPGVYFFKININGTVYNKKFVKI